MRAFCFLKIDTFHGGDKGLDKALSRGLAELRSLYRMQFCQLDSIRMCAYVGARASVPPAQLVLPVIMGGYIKHSGFLLPGNQPVRAEPAEAPHLRSVSKKIVANKSPAATSDLSLLIANLTFGLLNKDSVVNFVQEATPSQICSKLFNSDPSLHGAQF